MSESVRWIGAVADERDFVEMSLPTNEASGAESNGLGGVVASERSVRYNFPAEWLDDGGFGQDDTDRNPDLWLYRDRTVGLLRRFLRFSLETGRLPSLVGREFFRAKVTSYTAVTFEDRVIFIHDVEKCLDRLAERDQELIARMIMQEHSQEKAARLLHCSRKTVQRRLAEVLDLLSEDFLRIKLLVLLPPKIKEQP